MQFLFYRRQPQWAIDLKDAQMIIMFQNELILAKLEKRGSKLSPEDQAKVNKIFAKASGIVKKIDEAEEKTAPAGPPGN